MRPAIHETHCDVCGNLRENGECKRCDVDHFCFQHEDDCTGHVRLYFEKYTVRGTPVQFTQLGDDAVITLEHEGVSKPFDTERDAYVALARWRLLQLMLPPFDKIAKANR